MVITDGPLFKLGLVDPVVDALRSAGVTVEVHSDVRPDPTYEQVLDGVARLKAFGADAVLAMGGGSPIDCAKAMLMCHANDAHPSKLLGLWLYALPRRNCLPFYAIPTTAGTGSEVTIAAVVTDPQARSKAPIIDPKMVPIMTALDARLTLGLPPVITAPTGMDALTHAVEAYVSTISTTETSELALSATSAIMRNLSKVYADGSNLQTREDMLVGSCLAGLAFTRAGLGYVHAFAHQMGGLYHVPHGYANAIILPYVLDFSKSRCAPRLAELARVVGLPGGSDAALADAFIARVRELNASMQIPAFIKELKREDFDAIVKRAFAEAHGTYGLPRYMARADALALLEKLLPR
jgi:alcohol dehydrogenase class IV